ncbi:MAG: HEPN domain-containing protein [Planctomycetota bacterium]
MRPEQEFALQWIRNAEHDLLSAKAVIASAYDITDLPCFFARQTVEKSLKALLTWHGVSFGKTHDLLVLLAEAVMFQPSFSDDRTLYEQLTGFAVEMRYPSSMSEPSLQEARRFVSEAQEILNPVKRGLAPTAEQ